MPELFHDFVLNYVNLPKEDWKEIKKEFRKHVFQKDEKILEEGKICRYFK